MEIRNYNTEGEALRALTYHLMEMLALKGEERFHLALSGGGTANKMFSLWVEEYADKIDFHRIHFYWVDERCVLPHDAESNYGHAKQLLFDPLSIPENQIFRIRGEFLPEEEATHYTETVRRNVPVNSHGYPLFDCILLGVGNDLHTASIFPDSTALIYDRKWYAVSRQPQTGQRRITMTGQLLLAGSPLLVAVVGKDKEEVIRSLNKKYDTDPLLPALYILYHATDATVYTGH